MRAKRLGVLTVCGLGLVLTIGVAGASSAGSTQVLKLHLGNKSQAAVGFNLNSNTPPPVGALYIITGALYNGARQFGKPTGARVGRVLLDCTFLSVTPTNADGICTGIVHVPNGYFTIDGSGGFSNAKHPYYAITGGVGTYANDRGQIRTGGGTAIATLYSP